MKVLCIRADNPDVYIGLWENGLEIVGKSWQAGRELSSQIFNEIESLCKESKSTIDNIDGIIVYQGPGSYTGLRISISTANALAYSQSIPVVGSSGERWVADGMNKLDSESGFEPIFPVYGGEVYTTQPKK